MERQRIAFLGWGSLIWDTKHPRAADFDKWHDAWQDNGPGIKLEFSRVSTRQPRQGVLTLVIDPNNGALCRVQYCFSKRTKPDEAFADLAVRENMTYPPVPNAVGRIFRKRNQPAVCRDPATRTTIETWANAVGIDVVVWTDLSSNFTQATGKPFTVPDAIAHLEDLESSQNSALDAAFEYIREAPAYVRTSLRTALEAHPRFKGAEALAKACTRMRSHRR